MSLLYSVNDKLHLPMMPRDVSVLT